MNKRECAHKIAEKLNALYDNLCSGKITPLQHTESLRTLYSDMQRESGYENDTFAQVWRMGCREHNAKYCVG